MAIPERHNARSSARSVTRPRERHEPARGRDAWLTRRRSAGSARRSGYSDTYLNDNWILVR